MPTKQRSPRQNAKAEAGVKLAQRWVPFRLRGRVFFSLDEANAEIRRLNELLNDRKLTKSEDTRRTRFLALDAPALRPLPSTRYELSEWRHSVRVADDYLIEHGKCYYSVPWQHRGDVVDLLITGTSLEILHLDMTPLVDLGFLLIPFFMLTTHLIDQWAMNMELPLPGKATSANNTFPNSS